MTDVLDVIEAAYAEAPDIQTWLEGIVAAAAPSLDQGFGVSAQAFSIDREIGPLFAQGFACGPHRKELLAANQRMVAEAGTRSLPGFLTQVSLLSSIVPPSLGSDFVARHYRKSGGLEKARDVLGVVSCDPSGRGTVLSAPVPGGWQLTAAFSRRWRYVVAHLASGIRLQPATDGTMSEEAVLNGKGELLDARGEAVSRGAQLALRRAARAVSQARSRRSRAPEAAIEAWRALVEARWSLVDRFDSNGRRFLIAKANPPQTHIRPLFLPEDGAGAILWER